MKGTRFRSAGFTLSELLITVTVSAILLAIAVPSFDNAVQNNRRANAVNQFVSTLHLARSEAIARNNQVTICASSNGQACNSSDWSDGWLVFADIDRNRQISGGDTLLGTVAGNQHITIGSQEHPQFVAYRPNGRIMGATATDNTGEFTFCDRRGADHARVVIIDSSGQTRLAEQHASGAAPVCDNG